jgi:hypothetical protein
MKTKQPKNIAAQAFPDQFKRLRPESTERGGVKARSGSEARRMEVYRPIAELFKHDNPWCVCCAHVRGVDRNDAWLTEDVHHSKGREGLLLFDVRNFMPVCRSCHQWIHAHPAEAKARGWLK